MWGRKIGKWLAEDHHNNKRDNYLLLDGRILDLNRSRASIYDTASSLSEGKIEKTTRQSIIIDNNYQQYCMWGKAIMILLLLLLLLLFSHSLLSEI